MATTAGEIGRIGQKRYGGFFYEEFLKELQGRKGVETYREMADNDDVIGAILFAIEMLIRQTSWTIQPGGPESADEEAAEFIESCMDDMQDTWTDTISEILSFLTYGWSYHEIVYKRRCGKNRDSRLNSKYDDGLIGWAKLLAVRQFQHILICLNLFQFFLIHGIGCAQRPCDQAPSSQQCASHKCCYNFHVGLLSDMFPT